MVRLPVQRSVETGLAVEFKARFTRQPSRDPDAEDPKPGAYARNSPFSRVASFFAADSHLSDELIFSVCVTLQFDISRSEAGIRQAVHGVPGGARPRPAGRTPDPGHAPHG